ncbi:TIGR03087 family PEP-CTERM/XrtA system glycosyltransferase [Pacificimonas sp. ICDLI1SI03]|jgi:sugar transferase (PEP-CTERM/EpsH1 system associated)|tara:strand:+ start:36612 stop:37832 length:1221 start_codon:yes stop_codon:yes gene_type:complete
MAKPELLFLSHRIPYPPDKGDKIRSWNILKHLTERFDVHLGAFVDDPADRQHEPFLRSICKDVCLLDVATGRARASRLLGGLASAKPLSIAMWEDREMHRFVRALLDRGGVDHVFLFSGQMAPYVLKHTTRRRLIVMDFVDIDSDKFRQYSRQSSWPKSKIYAREAKLLAQFEKNVARNVDASLFVSEAEAALFKSYAGSYAHTVYPLNNGVDLDYFSADADFTPMTPGQPAFVLTGAMDYKPNIDAAIWMAKDILPRVRKTLPKAEFWVVGSSPSKEVKALGKREGISVTGRVPDVRPYVAAADIAVAPIRIARGVQNKVLEAMAMGRPVVATQHAFSGIHAEPGRDLCIADSAEDFAAQLIELMQDEVRRRDLGAAARSRMVAEYSWPHQMQRLDAIIERHKVS